MQNIKTVNIKTVNIKTVNGKATMDLEPVVVMKKSGKPGHRINWETTDFGMPVQPLKK